MLSFNRVDREVEFYWNKSHVAVFALDNWRITYAILWGDKRLCGIF